MYRRSFASIALAATVWTAVPASAQTPASKPSSPPVKGAAIPTPAPQPSLPPVPAVAPGYAAPAVSPPPANLVGVTQQVFVGITLQNAIGMSLMRNPDLAIAQANRRIAQYGIAAAKGAYDVNFSIEPLYQYVSQAPQNAFFAGPNFGPIIQQNTSLNAGAAGILPGGQQYSVNVQGKQTYDNTTINSFNPYFPTIFSVNFSQPLGRGREINQASRNLLISQINADASTQQTLSTASSTIGQVENAYWDLVAAWRSVAIQEEALKDTIRQQHSNVRLARQGANAAIDVVQSNAQIAVFQDDVYAALQNVALLQNRLKTLLLSNPDDPVWRANLVPTTPVLQLPTQPSLAELVTTALRQRPELAQVRDQRRTADVNLRFAQNQIQPQVNLQLGYTSNGFSGDAVNPANIPFLANNARQVIAINQLITAVNQTLPPSEQIPALPNTATPTPPYLQGSLDQSIKNLLSNKFPVYSAGVQITFPIGNTTARADYEQAKEQERVAQLQEVSTIQSITAQVRDALQAYLSAQSRLAAATVARQSSEQILASERRRFQAGESTTFLVLQREIELADNRDRELRAQTELNKAVVGIEASTGTILSINNVNVTNVGEGALKP